MIESSLRVRDQDIQGFWPADYDVAWAA